MYSVWLIHTNQDHELLSSLGVYRYWSVRVVEILLRSDSGAMGRGFDFVVFERFGRHVGVFNCYINDLTYC